MEQTERNASTQKNSQFYACITMDISVTIDIPVTYKTYQPIPNKVNNSSNNNNSNSNNNQLHRKVHRLKQLKQNVSG